MSLHNRDDGNTASMGRAAKVRVRACLTAGAALLQGLQHRPLIAATLIVALALVVRGLYLISYLHSPLTEYQGVDHAYYLDWARRIAAGNPVSDAPFEQGPLYAYLLAGGLVLFQDNLPAILGLQMLLGALGCGLVYACGRRLFDPPTALLAGMAAAVYGPLMLYEASPMKSFLSPLLTLVVLYAGLRYNEGARSRWLWLAGAAIGAAALLRENHLLFWPVLAWWVWRSHHRAGHGIGVQLRRQGVLLLALVLVLAPATAHNRLAGGEWALVTTGGGEVLYIAQGPWAGAYYAPPPFVLAQPGEEHEAFRREAERRTGRTLSRSEASRFWFQAALDHMMDHPWRALGRVRDKALALINDFEVPDSSVYEVTVRFMPWLGWLPSFGWIIGPALLGMALALGAPGRQGLALGLVSVHVLTVLVFYNFGRFRLGMVPLLLLFAASALVWLIRCRRSRRRRSLAVLALVAVLTLTVTAFQPRHPVHYQAHAALVTGMLASRHGDPALAEDALQEALALWGPPSGATGHYLRGQTRQELAMVHAHGARYKAAVEQLRQARRIARDSAVEAALLQREIRVLDALRRRSRHLDEPLSPTLEAEREAARSALDALAGKPP